MSVLAINSRQGIPNLLWSAWPENKNEINAMSRYNAKTKRNNPNVYLNLSPVKNDLMPENGLVFFFVCLLLVFLAIGKYQISIRKVNEI